MATHKSLKFVNGINRQRSNDLLNGRENRHCQQPTANNQQNLQTENFYDQNGLWIGMESQEVLNKSTNWNEVRKEFAGVQQQVRANKTATALVPVLSKNHRNVRGLINEWCANSAVNSLQWMLLVFEPNRIPNGCCCCWSLTIGPFQVIIKYLIITKMWLSP